MFFLYYHTKYVYELIIREKKITFKDTNDISEDNISEIIIFIIQFEFYEIKICFYQWKNKPKDVIFHKSILLTPVSKLQTTCIH